MDSEQGLKPQTATRNTRWVANRDIMVIGGQAGWKLVALTTTGSTSCFITRNLYYHRCWNTRSIASRTDGRRKHERDRDRYLLFYCSGTARIVAVYTVPYQVSEFNVAIRKPISTIAVEICLCRIRALRRKCPYRIPLRRIRTIVHKWTSQITFYVRAWITKDWVYISRRLFD